MYELATVTLGEHRSMRAALDRLQRAYESLGVRVWRIKSCTTDAVFHRDVFAWTPWGFIQCRMGKDSRAREPDHWFDAMGVYPALVIEAPGTFEGADLLWVGKQEVFLAEGARTNKEGLAQVRDFLVRRGAVVHQVALPAWHDQHLLGLANWAAGRMWSTPELMTLPRQHTCWRLPAEEVLRRKGSNWVQVGEAAVMPGGCPQTAKRLRAAGVKILPIAVGDLLAHGGGIACATGVMYS
jgi:N-dimethylarginine dimethylaminohydrolase